MKAVITADLHFSMYSQDPIIDGLTARLYYLNNVVRNSILQYAIDNNIQNCIVAGDIFHNKSIIHSKAMAVFIDIINDFNNIHFYLIDGNHDHSKMSGDDVTSLKPLEKYPNVTVIHDPMVIDNIYFVPWNNKIIDNIKNPPSNDIKYLISHIGLNEGKLNSGISIISDIKMADLVNKYKYVFFGHYHKPQYIESNGVEFHYIGSPIQLDAGERGDEKRFLSVDFENDKIESIVTTGYKKYFKFKLTENNLEDIDKIKELKNKGHDVIVEITDTSINLEQIPEDIRVIDKSDIDITNRGINLDMSENDRLQEYLKIKNIPSEEHDMYMKMAINIINMDDTKNGDLCI